MDEDSIRRARFRLTRHRSTGQKDGDTVSARSTWLRVLILGGGVASLPLTIDAASGAIKVNEACAQNGGTCCFQLSSICVPPGCVLDYCMQHDSYWQDGPGPCP